MIDIFKQDLDQDLTFVGGTSLLATRSSRDRTSIPQDAECACCSKNHRHPETGETLACDREIIFRTLGIGIGVTGLQSYVLARFGLAGLGWVGLERPAIPSEEVRLETSRAWHASHKGFFAVPGRQVAPHRFQKRRVSSFLFFSKRELFGGVDPMGKRTLKTRPSKIVPASP